MFECKILVDDKRLADVLWALDGKIVGEPMLRPIRAAKPKANKVVSTQPIPGAGLTDNVMSFILTKDWKTITTAQLHEALLAAGSNKNSMGYVTSKLRTRKFLSTPTRIKGEGKGARSYRVLKSTIE